MLDNHSIRYTRPQGRGHTDKKQRVCPFEERRGVGSQGRWREGDTFPCILLFDQQFFQSFSSNYKQGSMQQARQYSKVKLKGSLDILKNGMIRLSVPQYFKRKHFKTVFVILEPSTFGDMGQMLKVTFIFESKKQIKLVMNLQCSDRLIQKLNQVQMKYYLRQMSKVQENQILHQTYLNNRKIKDELKEMKQYAYMCTFNGQAGHLVIAEREYMVVYKNSQQIVRISRFEEYKEHLYWLEFQSFWIGFSSRGKKLAFMFQMKNLKPIQEKQAIKSKNIEENIDPVSQTQVKSNNFKNFHVISQAFSTVYKPKQKEQVTVEQSSQPIFNETQLSPDKILEEKDPIIRKLDFSCQKEQKIEMIKGQSDSEMKKESSIKDYVIECQSNKQKQQNDEKQQGQEKGESYQKTSQKINKIIDENTMLGKQDDSNGFRRQAKSSFNEEFSQNEHQIIKSQNKSRIEQNFIIEHNNPFKQNDIKSSNLQHQEEKFDEKQVEQKAVNFSLEQKKPKQSKLLQKLNEIEEENNEEMMIQQNWPQIIEEEKQEYQKMESEHSFHEEIAPQHAQNIKSQSKDSDLVETLQLSSLLLATLSSSQTLSIHKGNAEKLEYDSFQKELIFQNSKLKPKKLFESYESNKLHYLEETRKGIFSYDTVEQKTFPILQKIDYFSSINDVKAINQHCFGLLTDKQIKILDIRNERIVNEEFKEYKVQRYNFQKLDIQGQKVAVGQQDGIIKLYDLRYFHKRSMNNIDLRMDTQIKGQYYQRKYKKFLFDSIQIMKGSNNIFCNYNNSAFLVTSASKDATSSIFEHTLWHSNRIPVVKYFQGDNTCKNIFRISKNGSKIIQHSQRGQKEHSLNSNFNNIQNISLNGIKSEYIAYDRQSDTSNIIQGYRQGKQIKFRYILKE